jgi:L-lactate dehydrogenase complex protein LldE
VAVLNTRAEVCTATDNSCLMHINGALHRQRTGVETMHLAEILAASEEDASESEPFFPGCAR